MKFVYLSHETEVSWRIDTLSARFHLMHVGESLRNEVRKWIDESCSGLVFVWHGSTNDSSGSSVNTTVTRLLPSAVCVMVFDDPEDESAFLLSWSHMLSEWEHMMMSDWHLVKSIVINSRRDR